ncbi:MAG: hypothetical protein ACREOO_25145 [bacterium]
MILGMSISTFTVIHTVISLIAILAGIVVVYGMLTAKRLEGWTAFFLTTTVLTSVTGFFFPFAGVKPPHVVGAIALIVLAITIPALYKYHLAGSWRWIYIVGAVISLYLNVFVAVVQAFQKLSFLKPLAPTQSELPFLVAQLAVLALFIVLGIKAVKSFTPTPRTLAFSMV